jgi:hypothetical protein
VVNEIFIFKFFFKDNIPYYTTFFVNLNSALQVMFSRMHYKTYLSLLAIAQLKVQHYSTIIVTKENILQNSKGRTIDVRIFPPHWWKVINKNMLSKSLPITNQVCHLQ